MNTLEQVTLEDLFSEVHEANRTHVRLPENELEFNIPEIGEEGSATISDTLEAIAHAARTLSGDRMLGAQIADDLETLLSAISKLNFECA